MNVKKLVSKLTNYRFHKPGPIIVATFLVVLVLSSLRISGSSIAQYNIILGTKNDSNLLSGKPRPIRSDEWLVSTQMTLSQEKDDYARVNSNFRNGMSMDLLSDAPVENWTAVFKPQNTAFLFFGSEVGLAFKWWFMLWLLFCAVLVFSFHILSKLKWSILISLFTVFSPFIFWWYLNGTILTFAYGFIILYLIQVLFERTIKKQKTARKDIFLVLALAYTSINFILIFYPPFQIPVAIGIMAYVTGLVLSRSNIPHKKHIIKKFFKLLTLLTLPVIIIIAIFIFQERSVLSSIQNTSYPGKRVVSSGGMEIFNFLSGHLSPQLQNDDRAANFLGNQSEASNFVQIGYFLLPLILLSLLGKSQLYRSKKLSVLAVLSLVYVFLLARVFLPFGDLLFRPFALDKVPHQRLLIGFGFINILILIQYIKNYELLASSQNFKYIKLVTTMFIITSIAIVTILVRRKYPNFILNDLKYLTLSIFISFSLILLIYGRIAYSLVLLALFGLASIYRVHPLYRGLSPILDNPTVNSIRTTGDSSDVWISNTDLVYENFPQLAGKKSITGLQTYPDTRYWEKVLGSDDRPVFNRYAHITSVVVADKDNDAILAQNDVFQLQLSCKLLFSESVDYVLSQSNRLFLDLPCVRKIKDINYPNVSHYIYQVEQ